MLYYQSASPLNWIISIASQSLHFFLSYRLLLPLTTPPCRYRYRHQMLNDDDHSCSFPVFLHLLYLMSSSFSLSYLPPTTSKVTRANANAPMNTLYTYILISASQPLISAVIILLLSAPPFMDRMLLGTLVLVPQQNAPSTRCKGVGNRKCIHPEKPTSNEIYE